MNRLEKNDKQYSYERSSERERSSDRESNSSKDSYRRSSSRTDDDEYKSISEERGNGNHKRAYDKSRERERYRDDKSRRIRHSSNERYNQSHRKYKKHRERDRSHEKHRSYSSSDDNDSYSRSKRRKSRSRSRSRDRKSREREPRRNKDSMTAQKSGDRRLFPLASDDRNSISTRPSELPDQNTSWREGGPLPPPVFIGSQSSAPPPPNISGNVPPQSWSQKDKKSSNQNVQISNAVSSQESSRSSFVPPSFLTMPPHPSSIASNQNVIPPPLGIGCKPLVPPPLRPPPGAPPPLGHRPPPPPVRPKMHNTENSDPKPSQEVSHGKIVNYHDAPKAPKRIPEIKPEVKRSPPKLQAAPIKNIAIKLGATPKAKPTALNAKLPAKVASVFGADSDSEEEMPQEAKMRMRNVGRETITSSGPNSFGKTRQGFTDTKKLYEKNMHKPLFEEDK